MKRLPISLQINVTALDMPFLPFVLPHQLQAWGDVCSEIVVVIDPIPGQQAPADFVALLFSLSGQWPQLRVQVAQRNPALRAELSRRFFRDPGLLIPDLDWRQAPFFAYFYGWAECSYPIVLHLDADILIAREPAVWLPWAYEQLKQHAQLLALAPALGPRPEASTLTLDGYAATAAERFSTRIYLIDLARIGPLPYFTHPPEAQPPERQVAYRARFCAPYALAPEDLITIWMQAHNHHMLTCGGPMGTFSLHPAERGPRRERLFPKVLRALEREQWPTAQQGQDIDFAAWEAL